MTERVVFTPEAVALVAALKAKHGPLIFHLSGGCCEGSAPMCFRQSDFRVGASDVLLGEVDGCPFYVGAAQFDYWSGCQIIVDVDDGGRRQLFAGSGGRRAIYRALASFHRRGVRGAEGGRTAATMLPRPRAALTTEERHAPTHRPCQPDQTQQAISSPI